MGRQVTRLAKMMMIHKITTLSLIAGFFLGAAATEVFNVYRQSRDGQVFQERVRCKTAADAYLKGNNPDSKEDPFAKSGVTLTLDKADYSPARNSCVAELDKAYWSPRGVLDIFSVQDLLSGETLFQARCTKCTDLQLMFADPAFDYVMKNASEPLELQEKYDNMQKVYLEEQGSPLPDSKRPSSGLTPDSPASKQKSASSSPVTKWDAQGNPIPPKSPTKPAGSSVR